MNIVHKAPKSKFRNPYGVNLQAYTDSSRTINQCGHC